MKSILSCVVATILLMLTMNVLFTKNEIASAEADYCAHVPEFTMQDDDVTVDLHQSLEEPIYTVNAVDIGCKHRDNCDCPKALYHIASQEEPYLKQLFSIDAKTGKIYILEELSVPFVYYLVVGAETKGLDGFGNAGSEMTLRIVVTDEDFGLSVGSNNNNGYSEADQSPFASGEIRHREKRSVAREVTEAVSEIEFYIEKLQNVTDMSVGTKLSFELAIHLPAGESDLLVELFTDNGTMIVCDVNVECGDDITPACPTADDVVMFATSGNDYDMARVDFGNLTMTPQISNGDTSTVRADNEMVFITWDAVMIATVCDNSSSPNWISAGAETNNSRDIWVAQARVTCNETIPETSESPEFNFTGPVEMKQGTSAVFTLDIYIPYPITTLLVEVFAPLNETDSMSVCSLMITDTGDNYKCLQKELFNATYYESSTGKSNSRAALDAGAIINADVLQSGFLPDIDKNRITVEFTMFAFNETAAGDYWVGAAIDLNSEEIFAGQMNVTIVDSVETSCTITDPELDLNAVSGENVTVFGAVAYELDIILPPNSEYLVDMVIQGAYNDSARMKICDVSVVYHGVNIPCFEELEIEYTSRDDSDITDMATISQFHLLDNGGRSTSFDEMANTFTLKIVAQALNHSLNVVDEKLWLAVGVSFCDETLWVSNVAVTIQESSDVAAPNFNITYPYGDGTLAVGQSTELLFDIYATDVHPDLELEIITPFENDTAVLRVCRAEVVSNGLNLPCFDRETANSSFAYTSRNGSTTIFDKAIPSPLELCLVKDEGDTRTDEDYVQISFIVQLLDHIAVENGGITWNSVGVQYSNVDLWVGQLSLTFDTGAVQLATGSSLFVSVDRTDVPDPLDDTVYISRTSSFSITIKMSPQSSSDMTVRVAADPGLSICVLRVKEVGRNFPCLDENILAEYTDHASDYYTQEATVSFGPVSNIGADELALNSTFDNNTFILEFVTYNYDDTVGMYNADVTVTYGSVDGDGPYTETKVLTMPASLAAHENETISSSNDTLPTIVLCRSSFLSGDNQSIDPNEAVVSSKGQSLIYNLDIELVNNSYHAMVIKFLTPVNQTGVMEISAAYIVNAGSNIPCLKKQAIVPTCESRSIADDPDHSYVDICTLDVGTVCHFTIDDQDPDANKFTVQAVVRITRNSSLSVNDQIWFSATVRTDDADIYVVQERITIVDDTEFVPTLDSCVSEYNSTDNCTQTVYVNLTESTVSMSPGLNYQIPLVLEIPENISTFAYYDIQMPMNDSAIATIVNVEMVSSGRNIGPLANSSEKEVTDLYNSTRGTSQNDYYMGDLGILTNSGITQRAWQYEEGDNTIVLNIEVQMTDAEVSENGTEFLLSFGLSLGDTCIYVYQKPIVVVRTDVETQDIVLYAEINETIVYDTETPIRITGLIQHTENSTAEGYNVTANFYFPSFLSFSNLVATNLTIDDIRLDENSNGVHFTFDRLFFTDIVLFEFELRVNGSDPIPLNTADLNATSPFGTESERIYRDNHVNGTDTWICARLESMSFIVIGPGGVGCEAIPLGMEDNSIQDCQISGSESPDDTKSPLSARLGGPSGWVPGDRATTQGTYGRVLDVNLGNVTRVTKVSIKHPPGNDFSTYSHVAQLVMWTSDDGMNWQEGETLSGLSYTTELELNLTAPAEARYFRLEVATNDDDSVLAALQAEFWGCYTIPDKTLEQVCTDSQMSWDTYSPHSQIYSRSVLSTSSMLYVCDVNSFKTGNPTECYFSTDGNTFESLDERLITLLGYSAETGEVFGVAWDKRSVVASDDNGQTWYSVSMDYYNKIMTESDGWESAQEIPYERQSSAFSSINLSSRSATYDGVEGGGSTLVTWNTCCA